MNKNIYRILMIVFALVFVVSTILLIDYFVDSQKEKDLNNDLASQVQQDKQEATNPSGGDATGPSSDSGNTPESPYKEIVHPVTGETIQVLYEYATVFLQNTDMIGWIRLDGTVLDYPVMQTPNHANYYLKRNFNKEYSKYGCVYANETADLLEPSDNVTLYGHNMSDGTMFAPLHKYNDKAFFEQQPYITFDTIYEHHTYQILSVFYTTDWIDTGFAYHRFVDGTEKEFNDFVATCKDLALYDTDVTATYGDKLLTLSTCDDNYADDHGRFVVVAKRIS